MNEAENRKLAEWLEPLASLPNEDDSEEMQAYESVAWIATFRLSQVTGMHVPSWEPMDFYRDEAANALLLEKFEHGVVKHFREPEEWVVFWDEDDHRCTAATSPERKTAIVQAALQRIERGEK